MQIGKDTCTGCNVCIATCSVSAIKGELDEYGFWYPKIDLNSCIGCKKCDTVCPTQHYESDQKSESEVVVYAAWNLEDAIRCESSSGGVFSALSMEVLINKGYVVGASFSKNDPAVVNHRIIHELDKLSELVGSKYVQSYIDPKVFNEINILLKNGNYVLFSGTPCQVAGLEKYLQKPYDNLLTVDIVCHGVPSPKAWGSYLKSMSRRLNGEVTGVRFRAKPNGWKKYEMELTTETCNYSFWFNEDDYGKSFIQNMFLRECCYNCQFKMFPRVADVSLGDFWKVKKEFDAEDKGTSLVICNSEKGRNAFLNLKNIFMQQVPLESAYLGNYALLHSSKYFKNRKQAFDKLQNMDFHRVIRKYSTTSLANRVKSKIRKAMGYSNE